MKKNICILSKSQFSPMLLNLSAIDGSSEDFIMWHNLLTGLSCNRHGQYSCLRCKTCYCEEHVRRKGFKYDNKQKIPCPKCGFDTEETKELSMSSK